MNASRVSENIYLIDTLSLGFRETVAAYLILGDKYALVDMGYASSLESLLKGIRETGVNPSELDYLIPTHVHLDHVGSLGHLSRIAGDAEVLAHPRAVKHIVNPSRLMESVRSVFGEKAELFGELLPTESDRVRAVNDYERLDLGSLTLTLIHSPGHAPHQITVFAEEEKALITGDAVSIDYPYFPVQIPTTPPPSYSHGEALETLRKLKRLNPRTYLRPHFGAKRQDGYLDQQIELLNWWRDLIGKALEKGMDRGGVIRHVMEVVAGKAGVEVERLPTPVKVDIEVSVSGMIKYLQR